MVGDGGGDGAVGFLLSEVADELDDVIGDSGGATASFGDDEGALGVNGDVKEFAGSEDDLGEFLVGVVFEAGLEGEAGAEGGCEEACAGGGTDEGKFGDAESDGAGVWALIDHDVDSVVFHGGVEIFFDIFLKPVDFIDKKDITRFEASEETC